PNGAPDAKREAVTGRSAKSSTSSSQRNSTKWNTPPAISSSLAGSVKPSSGNLPQESAKKDAPTASIAAPASSKFFDSALPLESPAYPVVAMETYMGTINIELNKEKAPITVENFLNYVDD